MAITDRMIRASRGQVDLYEEVEKDPAATTEAMIVVAVVSLAGGIGAAILTLGRGNPIGLIVGLIVGVISALISWAVFAGVAYFIGTRLFNGEATWEEVLRTLGYAYSPLVVGILVFVPALGPLVVFVAALWTLYLGFVALRSALDITSGQTIATILLGIIPAAIVNLILQIPLAIFR